MAPRNTLFAYFWKQVCQPDAWLRIFHSFVYVEKKDVVDLKGNWSKKETLIFPRFHQWSAVNEMIADAKRKRPRHGIWPTTAPVPARPARFHGRPMIW